MNLREMFGGKPRVRTTREIAAERPPARFVVDGDLLSDVGCVRTSNEDAGRIFRDDEDAERTRVLVVVADGMGGHNAGEVASATAVEVLEAAFAKEMRRGDGEELRRAVERANSEIFAASERNAEQSGMGTTCTALLLDGGMAYSAHVGDSRLYLLRGGEIYLLTEDHSQVMEMVKAGLLEARDARHHPDKNVITRALGRQPKVEVSVWAQPMALEEGDKFLLCSDGLYDTIEDDELLAVVQPRSVASACEELVRLAKERGGTDNITVAIVRLHPVDAPSEAMRATRQMEVLQ